ncbi:MAG: hypothetical protein JWO72_1020 [Caulobacteraceae bacterium]|nr:hypothetical protein [Caulobacteraceae bacterium]
MVLQPDHMAGGRSLLWAGEGLAKESGQDVGRVAKLVDARDLKSLDFGHVGSIPTAPTTTPARARQPR